MAAGAVAGTPHRAQVTHTHVTIVPQLARDILALTFSRPCIPHIIRVTPARPLQIIRVLSTLAHLELLRDIPIHSERIRTPKAPCRITITPCWALGTEPFVLINPRYPVRHALALDPLRHGINIHFIRVNTQTILPVKMIPIVTNTRLIIDINRPIKTANTSCIITGTIDPTFVTVPVGFVVVGVVDF